MTTTPITIRPELLAVSVGYRNRRFIADAVLPRLAPINKTAFEYTVYRKEDGFTVPETETGRTSRPQAVAFGSSTVESSTVYHSLETTIPAEDKKNAEAEGQNLYERRTSKLTELLMLAREKRVAGILQNAANYGGNAAALSAGDRFDVSNANPLKTLMNTLDGMLVRGNKAVFGRAAWNAFCTHPAVVSAALGNSGTSGIATAARVAELLELDEVLIGESRINGQKPGQTASLERVWGAAVSLIYQEPSADLESMSFGYTAQTKINGGEARGTGTIFDPHCGPEGGDIIRVWERNRELVVCQDAGYLLTSVIG